MVPVAGTARPEGTAAGEQESVTDLRPEGDPAAGGVVDLRPEAAGPRRSVTDLHYVLVDKASCRRKVDGAHQAAKLTGATCHR